MRGARKLTLTATKVLRIYKIEPFQIEGQGHRNCFGVVLCSNQRPSERTNKFWPNPSLVFSSLQKSAKARLWPHQIARQTRVYVAIAIVNMRTASGAEIWAMMILLPNSIIEMYRLREVAR